MFKWGIFTNKTLIVDSIKIKHPFHWSIKWEMIVDYTIDEGKGTLDILLKDGIHKQIKGIKPKYYQSIRSVIDNFFKPIDPIPIAK
jgi:hypothetical protein